MIVNLVTTYTNGNRKIRNHLEPKGNKNNIAGKKKHQLIIEISY